MLITSSIYAAGSSDREIEYRPIILTVLDAETRQPIEGIKVFVVNFVYYERFFITDSISNSIINFYEYITNQNGVVEIPLYKYRFNRHHFIDTQMIWLNIDLINENLSIESKERLFLSGYIFDNTRFFRPRNEYKAGLVRYHTYTRDLFQQSERGKIFCTNIHIRYEIIGRREEQIRFPSINEEITFFLERFTGEVSTN
ncbi:MAG: hypothetical protein FWD47_13650 [Treponema sp.]|nr:hypothetical protein [Treponema sp.]